MPETTPDPERAVNREDEPDVEGHRFGTFDEEVGPREEVGPARLEEVGPREEVGPSE